MSDQQAAGLACLALLACLVIVEAIVIRRLNLTIRAERELFDDARREAARVLAEYEQHLADTRDEYA